VIVGLSLQKIALKVLERYAGKLARTVLRGVGAGNSPRLPENILGPKTFIGFASINLYLIDVDFYQDYFASLSLNWSQAEVECVLDRSLKTVISYQLSVISKDSFSLMADN